MLSALKSRDQLLKIIRSWFSENQFIEVETPIVLKTPCMEEHIDAIHCEDFFLRTSPELYHKRILGEGVGKIYEIGRCFRHGEIGNLHHPEYTMLEWYRLNSDYKEIMTDTKMLIDRIAKSFNRAEIKFYEFKLKDLFIDLVGWNPFVSFNADRFDQVLCENVEPYLASIKGAVFLTDYPPEAAALARCVGEKNRYAERWELYLDGIEIANAYSELTDSKEQRKRFEQCGIRRKKNKQEVYPIDEEFLQSLNKIPRAGGAALGIDRLLMWLMQKESLDNVIPFRIIPN